MSETVITTLEQVSCEWLTAVLRRSGALSRGSVTRSDVASGRGNWSTSGTLQLHYSPDAQGECPPRLFLKMVDADTGDGEFFGPSEVTYYTRDYVGLADAPLLRCYDGHFSESQQRYHLLLEDISATHVVAGEKELTLGYGLALAEALAILHARWWGAERLAEAGARLHREPHIRRFVAIAAPGAGHIVEQFAAELEPHWPAAIRDLFAYHPQAMIARSRDPGGFTLIHGDAGCYNIMVPRTGDRPLYLIDRQPFDWSLTTWLGVYDLTYALLSDLSIGAIQARRQWEMIILRRYHDMLLERGVQDYSWRQLFDDYRLCVAMVVYVAVEYCRGGRNEPQLPIWLPLLQGALTACDDLDCGELWR